MKKGKWPEKQIPWDNVLGDKYKRPDMESNFQKKNRQEVYVRTSQVSVVYYETRPVKSW